MKGWSIGWDLGGEERRRDGSIRSIGDDNVSVIRNS